MAPPTPVAPSGPSQPVRYRTGAIHASENAQVLEAFSEKRLRPIGDQSVPEGGQIEVWLSIEARVSNLTYAKNVWVDLHLFDESDGLVWSETRPLSYRGPADSGSDLFSMREYVYHGTGATPGSVWRRPDIRKAQFRLYCEMAGCAYSDGILHQGLLPCDQDLWNRGGTRAERFED
jgi:hypothetical protein